MEAYFDCSFILGLYFCYLWIQCFSYYMHISRFYSLWWHHHLNYRFGPQFQQWSRYYYYLFCNGEPILVCCQQLFHGLFSVFKSLMPHVLLSFPTLFNCKNDFWFYVISRKCRTTNSFSLADISQPFIFLIESPTRTFTFFVLLPILWFPFRWWIWNSRA